MKIAKSASIKTLLCGFAVLVIGGLVGCRTPVQIAVTDLIYPITSIRTDQNLQWVSSVPLNIKFNGPEACTITLDPKTKYTYICPKPKPGLYVYSLSGGSQATPKRPPETIMVKVDPCKNCPTDQSGPVPKYPTPVVKPAGSGQPPIGLYNDNNVGSAVPVSDSQTTGLPVQWAILGSKQLSWTVTFTDTNACTNGGSADKPFNNANDTCQTGTPGTYSYSIVIDGKTAGTATLVVTSQ